MSNFKKIVLLWLSAILGGLVLFATLPNSGTNYGSFILVAVLFLVGVICSFIFRKESSRSNKSIFFNFAGFFIVSAFGFVSSFVGVTILPGNAWAQFYCAQYLTLACFFLLSFAVIFVVVDSLFDDFKLYKKYIVTLVIVGGTFGYYNHPFFENPKYLYTTQDVVDYKAVRQSVEILESLGKINPIPEEVAEISSLGVWVKGAEVGVLFDQQKLQRVSELLPYLLTENGYLPLIWKPLYLNNIYMSVLCVIFIFVFFGYQYRNDPPQGAYIEKIIFLFLPYCSLEILHHYAYIKSVEYSTLVDVQQIGYYLTLLNLVILLVFFGLRLRFITSVKGEFYERELVSDAEHISRWRDAFDNLVVRHFLNPKAVHGRLFAPRTPRNET